MQSIDKACGIWMSHYLRRILTFSPLLIEMQTTNDFYEDENVFKMLNNLNTNYSSELAELVDMILGPKPEAELNDLQLLKLLQ